MGDIWGAAVLFAVAVASVVVVFALERRDRVRANAPMVGDDTLAAFGRTSPSPLASRLRFEAEARADIERLTGGAS